MRSKLVAFSLLIIALVLTTALAAAAATKLYSVVPAGTIQPNQYVRVTLVVPSSACDTCENIVGVRYGSYDYMVVGYNHPDSGPKLAVWVGQITSNTESWSQETWAESATAGSSHEVVIKHLGSVVQLILDGRQVCQVSVNNAAVTIVANGVTVPPPQPIGGSNGSSCNHNSHVSIGSSVNTATLALGAGAIALLIIAALVNMRGRRR